MSAGTYITLMFWVMGATVISCCVFGFYYARPGAPLRHLRIALAGGVVETVALALFAVVGLLTGQGLHPLTGVVLTMLMAILGVVMSVRQLDGYYRDRGYR